MGTDECRRDGLCSSLSLLSHRSSYFHHIERKGQHRPDIQPLQAIKSNHCVVYEHNSCHALAKTGDEQPTAKDFKIKPRKHRRLKLVRRAEGWVACRCDE